MKTIVTMIALVCFTLTAHAQRPRSAEYVWSEWSRDASEPMGSFANPFSSDPLPLPYEGSGDACNRSPQGHGLGGLRRFDSTTKFETIRIRTEGTFSQEIAPGVQMLRIGHKRVPDLRVPLLAPNPSICQGEIMDPEHRVWVTLTDTRASVSQPWPGWTQGVTSYRSWWTSSQVTLNEAGACVGLQSFGWPASPMAPAARDAEGYRCILMTDTEGTNSALSWWTDDEYVYWRGHHWPVGVYRKFHIIMHDDWSDFGVVQARQPIGIFDLFQGLFVYKEVITNTPEQPCPDRLPWPLAEWPEDGIYYGGHFDTDWYNAGQGRVKHAVPQVIYELHGHDLEDPAGEIWIPADYSSDNYVTVEDYFLFLNHFFAQSRSADFNGDGSVDVTDYFDYLTQFFQIISDPMWVPSHPVV